MASDLFHEGVRESFIQAVFTIMAQARQHTFQVLTKRPERAAEILLCWITEGLTLREGYTGGALPNLWLGTSIETPGQMWRAGELCKCPAAVRFLSLEPLLWEVDLTTVLRFRSAIHWVIVGGESGPGARPMDPDWVRSIRDQCVAAGVPFFFKQWGAWVSESQLPALGPARRANLEFVSKQDLDRCEHVRPGRYFLYRVGKKRAGRLLDGRTWDEYPKEVLA